MKQILKILLATGIVLLAALISAGSCDIKLPPASGTNTNGGNGGNGDGNGGGDGGCTGICPSTNLTLSTRVPISKINNNIVSVNAGLWGMSRNSHSDADDNNRGYDDAVRGTKGVLFDIKYPGATAAIFFVGRSHITKDTITMKAATAPSAATCSSSETGDNALAASAGGGHCRVYENSTGDSIDTYNYLGTVFNNTKTGTHARGMMRCFSILVSFDETAMMDAVITDNVPFNGLGQLTCNLAAVNSGGTGEINDAWVADSGSTTEVELYAIGIDISGKTIAQLSDDPSFNLSRFVGDMDNATIKKLLEKNKWGELKFKVKLVTQAQFDLLP